MKFVNPVMRIAIEWSVIVGLTMLIRSVDGFWSTLGLVWLTCIIAGAATLLRGVTSGKITLVLPATPATPESSRDDNDDFILSDAK